ncbi:MAG: mevalonate kinase [Polaribacter sp.]
MHKANGKLLLTSEYYVLDGALALAVPTRFGQQMKVEPTRDEGILLWKSYAVDGSCWFNASFSLPDLLCLESSDTEIAKTLHQFLTILLAASPEKFSTKGGLSFSTYLDFPREWGLGTSSTLIWMLAKWADYDPYELLIETMGGSGYDIACAGAEEPLLYTLENYEKRLVELVHFEPPFSDQLYFVYQGKKQNSRSGITHYRMMVDDKQKEIARLTDITKEIINCKALNDFCRLITEHEAIIGAKLKLSIVKESYFEDFPGAIKSLGAWGGDFILVASELPEKEVRNYFNKKGLEVFFRYGEMVM